MANSYSDGDNQSHFTLKLAEIWRISNTPNFNRDCISNTLSTDTALGVPNSEILKMHAFDLQNTANTRNERAPNIATASDRYRRMVVHPKCDIWFT